MVTFTDSIVPEALIEFVSFPLPQPETYNVRAKAAEAIEIILNFLFIILFY